MCRKKEWAGYLVGQTSGQSLKQKLLSGIILDIWPQYQSRFWNLLPVEYPVNPFKKNQYSITYFCSFCWRCNHCWPGICSPGPSASTSWRTPCIPRNLPRHSVDLVEIYMINERETLEDTRRHLSLYISEILYVQEVLARII